MTRQLDLFPELPPVEPAQRSGVRVGDVYTDTAKTMRPRDEHDHYPTPRAIIDGYLALNPIPNPARILDPGAGSGVWGEAVRALYPGAHITGVDVRQCPHNPAYDTWGTADYLEPPDSSEPRLLRSRGILYTAAIGNPPYKHAESFIWRALGDVEPGGHVIFLLRLAFLASQARYRRMFTAGFAPERVTVLSTRPSFTGDGKTYPTDFAIFRWVNEQAERNTIVDWLI